MNKCKICDKEFKSVYGLSAHSQVHNTNYKETREKQQLASKLYMAEIKKNNILKYMSEPNCCKQCNDSLSYNKRYNKFCSHHCSATYTNKKRIDNGYRLTVETKSTISKALLKYRLSETDEQSNNRLVKAKNTRLKNGTEKPNRHCKICNIKIGKHNKYDYCKIHYLQSVEGQKNMANYQKFNKQYVYNEWTGEQVYLLSGLEYTYYKYLVRHSIRWSKPKSIIWIDANGKQHQYFPDFYLNDSNEIIEIKGHWRNADRDKMNKVIQQNPDKTIVIIESKEVKSLD